MRRLLIIVMVAMLLLSGCSKKGNGADKSSEVSSSSSISGKNSNSSGESTSSENSGTNSSDEWWDGEDWTESEWENRATAEASTTYARADFNEIRPENIVSKNEGNTITAMKGGADAEANEMRNKILNAKDELKITGTKYYISPGGNDENDGKSPETAFRSIYALSYLPLNPGDGVLFERGAVLRTANRLTLKSGVSYGAYGTGAKPMIYGSAKNYAGKYNWKPNSKKNIWEVDLPLRDAGIVALNHGEAVGIKQRYINKLTENFDFYHDYTKGILYFYFDKGNPGAFYKSIEIGVDEAIFSMPSGTKDVTIDNINFRYSGQMAISGSSNKNITVKNCEVSWIGGSLQPSGEVFGTLYGNAFQIWNGGENIVFENNWLYQIFDAALTFQGNDSTPWKNISFSRNLIEYCAYSVEWWSRDLNTVIDNVVMNENIFRFAGYGWNIKGVTNNTSSHIYGSNMKNYKNLGSLVIHNNIFDCSYLYFHHWSWSNTGSQPDYSNMFYNNTYYQKTNPNLNSLKPNINNRFSKFGASTDGGGVITYASNQTEFEAAVKTLEQYPRLVKWLE